MTIAVHLHVDQPIHIHLHSESAEIAEAIAAVIAALIEGEISMTEAMARIKAAAQRGNSVKASARALIHEMAERIRENVGDPAALHALADEMEAETAQLEGAIVEHTDAENEPPIDPPVIPPDEV